MNIAIVIVVVVLILVAVLVFGAFSLLVRMARQAEASARERFPNARIISNGASCFGQQSRGVTQLRGNGTLVLTDKELFWQMWVPRRELLIPLSMIQAIETPTSFLGKTRFTPLLKVVFQNEAGESDAIAWHVKDLDGLKRALEDARS